MKEHSTVELTDSPILAPGGSIDWLARSSDGGSAAPIWGKTQRREEEEGKEEMGRVMLCPSSGWSLGWWCEVESVPGEGHL
jgi:hypothetical protein